MEITSSTLETDFSKSFEVRKNYNKFLFLVQILNSIFYFRRTHKNACFMLYFIILKKFLKSEVR
jgi:hypothetical protein